MDTNEDKNKKLGLMLSGGGTRGSFQIGALKHLIGDLGRQYDVVTGFSIGAISGALVAQEDFDKLYEIWSGMNSFFDVFTGNPKFYKGLFSFKPLRKLLEEKLDIEKLRASPTDFYFTVVDLRKGCVVECDKFSEPLIDWLLASASIPGAFPPMEIDGEQFVDGGVLATNPLGPAIKAGVDEIDVILCKPLSDWSTEERFESIVETSIRSIGLAQAEMVRVDIANCEAINEDILMWRSMKGDVNFVENLLMWRLERKKKFPLKELRYIKLNIIEPPPNLIGILDVRKEKIHNAIDVGYKKAVDVFTK